MIMRKILHLISLILHPKTVSEKQTIFEVLGCNVNAFADLRLGPLFRYGYINQER